MTEPLPSRIAEAYAGPETPLASPELSARLLAVQEAHARRTQRRHTIRRVGFALAATGGIALLAAAAPRLSLAITLERMARAIDDARSMHQTSFTIADDGTKALASETWYQNGSWRLAGPDGAVTLYDGPRQRIWRYDPATKTATVRRQPDGPFSYNPSGFSLAALLRDTARWGWKDRITVGDVRRIDGREARPVTIEPAREKIRIEFAVDAGTGRPFTGTVSVPTDRGWKVVQMGTTQYDAPLSPALFTPTFPKGTRMVDERQERTAWQQRLQRTQRATLTFETRRVVIRDIQVTRGGEVFVLYTAGKFGTEWVDMRHPDGTTRRERIARLPTVPLTITDDRKTEYLPRWDFTPTQETMPKNLPTGFVIDGEPVMGTHVSPATPGALPRRLILTLGGQKTVQDVKTPTCGDLPPYTPYLASTPFAADQLRAETTLARAAHAKNAAGTERARLEKALALYRDGIRQQDAFWRSRGDRGVQPDAWAAVAELQHALGRDDEARASLTRAREDDRIYGNTREKIARLEKALGR